jgi:hypothetical protein
MPRAAGLGKELTMDIRIPTPPDRAAANASLDALLAECEHLRLRPDMIRRQLADLDARSRALSAR